MSEKEIEFSEKATLKMLNTLRFTPHKSNWFMTLVMWIVDSSFGKYKRIDKFLSEQIENPSKDVVKLANAFKGKSFDEIAFKIEEYVIRNFRYKSDFANFGKVEYWATADEIIKNKVDDCDGLNSLIYILARLAKIPSFMIYCAIGNVWNLIKQKKEYHFFCVYYSPKLNKWVALDSTYYPKVQTIADKKGFKLEGQGYINIDYLFNEKYIAKMKL